jgi:SAM-dependent methyltransferase
MDLSEYRNSEREKERIADLMALLPSNIKTALDIGARDGFISKLLAERFPRVTALDLEQPSIDHERIHCVKGDVTALNFPDASFDLIFCAEVLEHIPTKILSKACSELSRVSNRYVIIGVPYKQDIRVGRTTCRACGKKNPPWGHVNSFDESRIRRLFAACEVVKTSFVGIADTGTNFLSCFLMDMAGNPYGTYSQDEPCVHCGAVLKSPPERNLLEKVLTRAAFYARNAQTPFLKQHPNWVHILLEKRTGVN